MEKCRNDYKCYSNDEQGEINRGPESIDFQFRRIKRVLTCPTINIIANNYCEYRSDNNVEVSWLHLRILKGEALWQLRK